MRSSIKLPSELQGSGDLPAPVAGRCAKCMKREKLALPLYTSDLVSFLTAAWFLLGRKIRLFCKQAGRLGGRSAGGGYREQPPACRERRDTGWAPTPADFYGQSRLDCECRLGRTVRKGGAEFSDRLHFIPSSAPFWDAWSPYTLGWLPGHAVLPFPHLQNDRPIISCTSGRLRGIKQVCNAFKLIWLRWLFTTAMEVACYGGAKMGVQYQNHWASILVPVYTSDLTWDQLLNFGDSFISSVKWAE